MNELSYDFTHSFDAQIPALTELILADYTDDPTMDRMDTFNQPDKGVIISTLDKMMRLIFPGHYREGAYQVHSTHRNLASLVEDAAFQLKNQIAIVLREQDAFDTDSIAALEQRAQELAVAFFRRIPHVRALTKTDLQAAYDGDPAAYSLDEIIIAYPGLYAITVNRLAHELFLLGVPLIPRIMTEHAHSRTGIDIHPGATIGKYFFIDHGTGIVVGETTVIGDNVKIYQGVTLGALSTRGGQSLRGKRRHPTIENNVTIYAGASILGGNTIVGHDSVIGSNVFITTSVAPGTRVSVKNQELDFRGSNFLQDASWKE